MSKINVVEIIGDGSLAGAPTHLLNLIEGLHKFPEFNFLVICPPGPFLEKVDRIPSVNLEYFAFKSIFDLSTVRKIRQVLKRERQKSLEKKEKIIIHAHGTRGGWLGRLASIGLWMPVIYTEHLWTPDYHLKNKLSEYFQICGLWFLDLFTNFNIAVSGAVVDFMVRRITRSEKICLIYNGVKILKFKNDPDSKKVIIGSVGGLNYQKNYSYLLSAAKILKDRKIKNWQIEIVGDGEEKTKLEKLRRTLGLNDKVKILPKRTEPALKMAKFSIYVQPSRSESFGQALAQAMSLGIVPVVAARGALPEVVGKSGLIFQLKNPQDLANILAELIPDRALRKKLGARARRRAKKYFALSTMLIATKKLYESVALER